MKSRPAPPCRPSRRGSAVGPGVGAATRVAAAVGPGRWGEGRPRPPPLPPPRPHRPGRSPPAPCSPLRPLCRRRRRAGGAAGAGLGERTPAVVGRESPGSGGIPTRLSASRRRRLGPEGPSARRWARGRGGTRAALLG